MTIEAKVIKIGELLVSARLLDTSDVIEAIQVSHRLQIPVGRVLIMAGTVSEQLLQAALQAQIVINEGLVSVEVAGDALRIVARDHRTLQQALQQLNVPNYQQELSNSLVDLLLDSNIVSQEQLELAMRTSNEADIPLSGALVLQGTLSANFFPSILRAHDQIRTHEKSREEAINELKESFLIWLKADESWNSLADALHTDLRGGNDDRLVPPEAEIVSVTLDTVEAEPAKSGKSIIAEPNGSTGANGNVSANNTSSGASTGVPGADGASDAIDKPEIVPPKLVELFKQAGVFTQNEVQRGYEQMLGDPLLSGRVFIAMGLTDEPTMQFSLRCHGLIKKGLLTEEQAVRAIRGLRSGMKTQEEVLVEQASEQHPYFEKKWRSNTLRALGGGLVGALVAGIALSGRKR
ncbi:MAG: hypothetical protein JST89_20110 [Cyanobacteria bacterium SZAS-4]|nr:hypothetical protein [Cyanobacteria bacterium SZAS-4]